MKQIMKKRKLIVTLLLLICVSFGVTLALLKSTSNKLENSFTIGSVETEIREEVTQNGAVINKDPKVENIGESPALVRVRMVISPDNMITVGKEESNNLQILDNWEKVGDYYYYQGVLEPDAITTPLFDRITGVIIEEEVTENGETKKTYSYDEGKGPFEITIYQESIQSSVTKPDGTVINAKNEDGTFNSTNAQDIWGLYDKLGTNTSN